MVQTICGQKADTLLQKDGNSNCQRVHMHYLVEALRSHLEVTLFMVLALGYGIGNLRFGTFKLGPVMGVLIAGLAVGQLNIPISEPLKNMFFMFFLFVIGYRTGPQFFRSLRATGMAQIVLTVVIGATATVLTVVLARFVGFDAGQAAGLMAGAMTGTPALGAAIEAIKGLPASEAQRQLLLTNTGVAFAVTYLIGTVLVIWALTKFGPRLMGIDLATSCRDLEQEMGLLQDRPGTAPFVARAYTVPQQLDDKAILELEAEFRGYRVFVERLRHNGEVTMPTAQTRLHSGDHISMFGRRQALVAPDNPLRAYETLDDELLDLGIVSREVVVSSARAGRTLGELAENKASRGVFLEKFTRVGKELPFTLQTPIEPGDVLSVKGELSNIDRIVSEVGYAVPPTDATNMTIVSTAIFLGALIGLPRLVFRGIEVSLTLFVGVLLGGLVLGWLSSRHPRIGRIPEPALWLFDSLGLTGFLALIGLEAGPGFLSGWQQAGFALLGSAVVIVIVTNVIGILVGRYVLRMHPGLVLGACAGAVTSAPALGDLLETAQSRVPALSYGVGYALGNVVLAIGGAVIVTILGPR